MALPHFGYTLYCTKCWKDKQPWNNPCDCDAETISSRVINHDVVKQKRKIYLRGLKLERINGKEN